MYITTGTFPVVALMVGTAVQKLSNCEVDTTNDDITVNDDDSSSNNTMTTTNEMTCENDPVDIAVTLALIVGIFMVSS